MIPATSRPLPAPRRLRWLCCVAGLLAATAPMAPAHADSMVLKVFGPSALDELAPRQPPAVQKRIASSVIDGFLKANPDVQGIEWDAQGPQANGMQRLMTARLAEQPMDLIACSANSANGTLVRRRLVMPITEQIKPFQARIDATALGAFIINGQVYGVPISTLSTSTFYYDADMFKKFGIPVPPSYEDLKTAAPKLQAAGIIPVLHQGANAPLWPMWFFETFSQSVGDSIAKTQANLDGHAKFTDAPDVAGFTLIKQWVSDGLLSKDSLSVDQDGMRAAFANGRSAMYYGGTWEVPALQESVKSFQWGVFPFPRMPGSPYQPHHGGGADNGICVASNIAPAHLDAAMRFIAYLTQPDVAAIYLEPEQPIATSIVGVKVIDAAYAQSLRATTFPDTTKFLDWIWPSEVGNAVAAAIAGVVGGTLSPEQAAASVQSVFEGMKEHGAWPPK